MADLEKELKELRAKLNSIEKTINGQKNQLFGKPQSSLGNTTSDTVIQTLGTLKVRYGNKFVTIFKDGKLVTDSESRLIYTGSELGTKDGLYIIKRSETEQPSIYLVYKGISYLIFTSENSFLSFIEHQELTSNNKETAQKNIGIICSNLNELKENSVQNGFVYCLEDNKFYNIDNNQISEYKFDTSKLETDLLKLGSTTIDKNEIKTNSIFNINSNSFSKDSFSTNKLTCREIASPNNEFSISVENGESVLTIDKIISKNIYEYPLFYPYIIVTSCFEENSDDSGYFYSFKFDKSFKTNEPLEFKNDDLIFIDSYIFKFQDNLFKCLNGNIKAEVLIGKCVYPIKLNGVFINLFELSDEFKMIIPDIKTIIDEAGESSYEVDLSNVVLRFGKENGKSGLILYSGSQLNYVKYSDDSEKLPSNCNDKALVTKEWVDSKLAEYQKKENIDTDSEIIV